MLNLVYLCLIVNYQPFKDKKEYIKVVFSEFFTGLGIIISLLLTYDDLIPTFKESIKVLIGWVIIILYSVPIILYLIIDIYSQISLILIKIKKLAIISRFFKAKARPSRPK